MIDDSGKIGKYEVIGELGKGGQGKVYKVKWHSAKGEFIGALKILFTSEINSLLKEIMTWTRVSRHPNVLKLLDATVDKGNFLIVSELATEGDLTKWIKTKGGKEEFFDEAVEIMLGVLEGLEHLHENDIIHRDIKPANIFLKNKIPLLADFGLARALDLSQSTKLSGTMAYMSPELINVYLSLQVRNKLNYERTKLDDLWAVAVTFRQMLTGEIPFESIDAIRRCQLNPLSINVSEKLENFLKTSLTNNPSERFQTARRMREVLEGIITNLEVETIIDEDFYLTETSEDILEDLQTVLNSTKEVKPDFVRFDKEREKKNKEMTDCADYLSSIVFGGEKLKKDISEFLRELLDAQNIDERLQIKQPSINPGGLDDFNKLAWNLCQKIGDNIGDNKVSDYDSLLILQEFLDLLKEVEVGYVALVDEPDIPTQDKETRILQNTYLIPYRKNDRWGFCDNNKNIFIEPKYSRVHRFKEDLAAVERNKQWGFIDKKGNEIILIKYDEVEEYFKNGFVIVKLDGKYGLFNKAGQEIIPIKYDKIDYYITNDFFGVRLNGNYGLLNNLGQEVIPMGKYSVISIIDSDNDFVAAVEFKGKNGLIDRFDRKITPLKYDRMSSYSIEGLIATVLNNKYGFIDKTGQEVIPLIYDSFAGFSDGLTKAKRKGIELFIDKTGQEIIPKQYDRIEGFSDGLAKVKLNNKWGFIDKTGREIIPVKYELVNDFFENRAKVRLDGKWGFIDKIGRHIISFEYDDVIYLDTNVVSNNNIGFSEGLSAVNSNGKWGFIDTEGREIIAPKYDWVTKFSDGLALVEINRKKGFIDKMGQVVIPLKYSSFSSYTKYHDIFFFEGLAKAFFDKKTFYIGKDGTEYFD